MIVIFFTERSPLRFKQTPDVVISRLTESLTLECRFDHQFKNTDIVSTKITKLAIERNDLNMNFRDHKENVAEVNVGPPSEVETNLFDVKVYGYMNATESRL